MLRVSTLLLLAVAGCTEATASVSSRGNRTYDIQGPGVPGGSTAPDRRMAMRLCPDGYRVLNETVRNGTPDGYSEERGQVFTNWTIRCL
jgi:hypothetical protein